MKARLGSLADRDYLSALLSDWIGQETEAHMATISDTFRAMVTNAEKRDIFWATVYDGTLANGKRYNFWYRHGKATLRLGDTTDPLKEDKSPASVTHGGQHQTEIDEATFRALMLDLLKLHSMAPPFPLERGDIVIVDDGLPLFTLADIHFFGHVVPLPDNEEQRDLYVPLGNLRRVDRYARGKHKDGTPWRLDLMHNVVRLISGDTVIASPSSQGKAGGSGGFECLWNLFSDGRPDSWRSDQEPQEG